MPQGRAKILLLLGAVLLIGVGVVVLVLFGFSGGLGGVLSSTVQLAVGFPGPDFELEDLNGETRKLSDYRGRPVVINFWATWCSPCREEMPLLQDRYEQFAPDLAVLGVNFAESTDAVQEYAGESGLTFDILLDTQGFVQHEYRVRAFPTTYFIDAEGIIRAIHIGLLNERQLDAYLEKIGVGG